MPETSPQPLPASITDYDASIKQLYDDLQERSARVAPRMPSRTLRYLVRSMPDQVVDGLETALTDETLPERIEQCLSRHNTRIDAAYGLVAQLSPFEIITGDMRSVEGRQVEFNNEYFGYQSFAHFYQGIKRQLPPANMPNQTVIGSWHAVAAASVTPSFAEAAALRAATLKDGIQQINPEQTAHDLKRQRVERVINASHYAMKHLENEKVYPQRTHGFLWRLGRLVTAGAWDQLGDFQARVLQLHASSALRGGFPEPISELVIQSEIGMRLNAAYKVPNSLCLMSETSPLGLAYFAYKAYATRVNAELDTIMKAVGGEVPLPNQQD